MLKFHTQELPYLHEAGARFVVVAHYGEWRDGLATNRQAEIPRLQRELRKRFMSRIALGVPARSAEPDTTAP